MQLLLNLTYKILQVLNMKKLMQNCIVLTICLILTSCAMLTKHPRQSFAPGQGFAPSQGFGPARTKDQRDQQLTSLKQWRLQSVFSILYQGKLSMANLTWQQAGDRFYQRVSGPFNLGGVRIEGDANSVTMWKSPQKTVTAPTPEILMREQLGLRLPVSNLYFWIRDLPVPNMPAETKYDGQNHLVALQQGNWRINYTSFVNVNGLDLPDRMTLDNPELHIKLVIKQWNI